MVLVAHGRMEGVREVVAEPDGMSVRTDGSKSVDPKVVMKFPYFAEMSYMVFAV